ncbi:MAG: hypothetical protein LBS50_08585 [Prevotellaceae bacterium]|jgi:hypothetical protein|nr:hypothetical protein [Prevotellaceae bacterium]
METITGTQAIEKMRLLKGVQNATFGIIFFTHTHFKTEYTNNAKLRKYENCRLRAAKRAEGTSTNSDHYLFFTDLDTNEPRTCWKKLIRQARFGNTWNKVQWFL